MMKLRDAGWRPAGEVTTRPGSTLVFARDAKLAADGLRGVGRREENEPTLTRAEQLQGYLMILRYDSAETLRSALREPAVQARLDEDIRDIAERGEAALVQARDQTVVSERTPRFQVRLLREIDKDWSSAPLVLARSGGPYWPEILQAHQRASFTHDALRGMLMNCTTSCPEDAATARLELRAAGEGFNNTATLAGWGLLYVLVGLLWWPAAVIGLITYITAWRRGRAAISLLADLAEATVDLYSLTLAHALGFQLDTGQLTPELGEAITACLRKGT